MAEPKITIRLLSVADTSGVQQMTAAVKTSTAAVNPWTTASRSAAVAQRQLAQETRDAAGQINRLNPELRGVKGESDQAAKGTANVGQAMLAAGRGIDDMQYGLQGVINNFEQLAFAAGLSASGAGIVTALAVAVNLLAKNWDKLTGATKDMPSLGQLAPDEEATARAERFATALQKQADGYRQLAEARKASAEAEKQAMEDAMSLQELVAKRQAPEERGPGLELAQGYDQRTQARLAGLRGEEEAQRAREQELLMLDDQKKAQEKRLRDMQQREELTKQFQALQKQQAEDAAALGATTGQDFFTDMFSAGKMPSLGQLNALMKDVLPSLTGGNTDQATANTAKRYRDQAARMQEIQRQMGGLSALPLNQPLTGDAEKDQQIKQQAFAAEQQRLKQIEAERVRAAQEVAAGQVTVQGARQNFRTQQLTDLETYSQAAEGQTGQPGLPALDPGMMQADAAEAQRQGAAIAAQLQNVGTMRVQALTELSGGLQQFAAGVSAEIGTVKAAVSALQQTVNNIRTNAQ